jgi:uncharacterized protein YbbC (DUF1343 family)
MNNGQFILSIKGNVHRVCLLALLLIFSGFIQGQSLRVGAERTDQYWNDLKGKRIAVVANQTSRLGPLHLVDSLLKGGIQVVKVFSPEHGFRGHAAAGEHVANGRDPSTQLPIISLYGSHFKPSQADLADVDAVVFDIQDVGVRFYTYLSTLHYCMQACAENEKALWVLDRPNPNGFYMAGPILEPGISSMVGLHPIPLVHGMTLGELAQMINEEAWLGLPKTPTSLLHCDLHIITIEGWKRSDEYLLPIPPSPNLPTQTSIYLYPSLGLLEGTCLSMGRGTPTPFECYGAPWLKASDGYTDTFTPIYIPGKAVHSPYEGQLCHGIRLDSHYVEIIRNKPVLLLPFLINPYRVASPSQKDEYFKSFLTKLAGTTQLQTAIERGDELWKIQASFEPGLRAFAEKRQPYLLYP